MHKHVHARITACVCARTRIAQACTDAYRTLKINSSDISDKEIGQLFDMLDEDGGGSVGFVDHSIDHSMRQFVEHSIEHAMRQFVEHSIEHSIEYSMRTEEDRSACPMHLSIYSIDPPPPPLLGRRHKEACRSAGFEGNCWVCWVNGSLPLGRHIPTYCIDPEAITSLPRPLVHVEPTTAFLPGNDWGPSHWWVLLVGEAYTYRIPTITTLAPPRS